MLGSHTIQTFNANPSHLSVTPRLPSLVRTNSQEKHSGMWRIPDSIPDPRELTDINLLRLPHKNDPFCTVPFNMFCYRSCSIPDFSPLPNLLSFTSSLLFTGFSPKFQTLFFHLVSSTFQVTQQHPLFPPQTTPCLQPPSPSFSGLLPSMFCIWNCIWNIHFYLF